MNSTANKYNDGQEVNDKRLHRSANDDHVAPTVASASDLAHEPLDYNEPLLVECLGCGGIWPWVKLEPQDGPWGLECDTDH